MGDVPIYTERDVVEAVNPNIGTVQMNQIDTIDLLPGTFGTNLLKTRVFNRGSSATGHGAWLYLPCFIDPLFASCVFWKTRKMTNSAGRTGAIPISMIRRPLRISSTVIVSRPFGRDGGRN